MEKRKAHIAGISPATMLSLCIAVSSVVGTWFVMQDNISDNAESIEELEDDSKASHARIWNRISTHNH